MVKLPDECRPKSLTFIEPHPLYMALGSDRKTRTAAYRELFIGQLDKDEINAIRKAATFSMPLGDNRFKAQVEAALSRQVGYAKRGRPSIKEDEQLYY